MKNSSNIILGTILIIVGVVTLGLVNNWFSFDISLRQIAKFWPILIIFAGLAVLADSKRSVFNPASILLLIVAIPLSVYNCTGRAYDNISEELNNKELDFDIDMNDDEKFTYEENTGDSVSANHKIYKVDQKSEVTEAKLNISGGASQFLLNEATNDKAFEADTREASYSNFSLKDEINGSSQEITFKMKGAKNLKIGKDGISRKIVFKLNQRPVWDINMEVGAGDVIYDLSKYKVKHLDLETGASSIDLTLGDLVNESKIDIQSGAASINVKVPKNVGCEIQIDGALNSKNFTGFTKIESGLYKSEDFEKTTKKIYLNIESGVSSIEVTRY